ncbi:MAG TPA: sulfite exporter TauE/SafE family protein [Thermoanaerobaculales bacterium]|nr:sulfite exporter TauE/SafE family protein [Thermoanaerobaculales bacterium]HQL29604.1 sulfite exporter TauE/SafE family protein [Thermoanaerobaculales bacterium]HQN97177.1 sulfite exporter TauE/SafE family protein [Thermoanaerobaculales bacterium]HQP44177.1 sulfite exporter TauE/SafE family protein [Thermoanaerobaculales bacterium]
METVFSSLPQFVVACLILAGAQAIYVLLGFGAGMVAVGLLALILPELRDVIVILLLVNLPAEAYVVASSWRRVSWRGVLLITAGVAVGIPIGSFMLSAGDLGALLTLLGVVMVVVGGVFLLTPDRPPRPVPAWTAPPVGLVSGVLTGLFGTGGPPLIFYSQLKGDDKTTFRGTLMAIFLLMTVVRVPSYAAFGLITAPRVWSSLALVPAAVLGAAVGDRIHLRVDEATFRRLVSIALVTIGATLLARSL